MYTIYEIGLGVNTHEIGAPRSFFLVAVCSNLTDENGSMRDTYARLYMFTRTICIHVDQNVDHL